MNDLEQLAFLSGVVKTYAIQVGRELRVIVGADKIDDKDTENYNVKLQRRYRSEMTYPGQVKITSCETVGNSLQLREIKNFLAVYFRTETKRMVGLWTDSSSLLF